MKTELWHLTRVRDTISTRFNASGFISKQNLTERVTETGVSARPGITNDNFP